MPRRSDPNPELLGTWWRVPEEDAAPGHCVFRKDGAPLPPARGRSGFKLEADGSALLLRPGATDRREGSASHWRFDSPGRLHVQGFADAEGATVADLGPDRLVLRK